MKAIEFRCVHWIVAGAATIFAVGLSLTAATRSGSPQAGGQPAAPAQGAGRGAIQTPTGGRGPGAAPDAGDPANANADLSPKPPVVALTPAEQVTRFWLPPGYRLEPVLADPLIDSPAQITFDGNGRMFVVELRGYEQTVDGVDSIAPVGRISRHEDRDNDGVFEHHTVFVDKLLFPRFVMPLGANTILTMETNADEVWKYTDTNGDGVADKKELFATNFGRGGNLESQQAGLFWAMDNWMYSTVNAFRIRWTPTGLLREPTGPNGAQWSATQDDDGKVWFQHGASGMPGYFQFPIHYGNFAPPASEQFEPNLNITWGAPILHRRHSGGSARHAHARRLADLRDGLGRQRDLSRRPAAEGSGRRLPLRRSRRAHRPAPATRQDRRSHAAAERLPVLRVHPVSRSAVPPGRHRRPVPTAFCTSRTCTAASSKVRRGR